MRPGLRPQLLLLVSLLLGLAFVPIFWTAATFTRVSLQRSEHAAALHLGQAVGRAIAAGQLDPELIPPIKGLTFERKDGTVLRLGESVPKTLVTGGPSETGFDAAVHPGLIWSVSRGNDGLAYVGVELDQRPQERPPFVGLMALYLGLLGTGLLLAIYLALTFLIVRPLDALGHAAHRVTRGMRSFELPKLPARELSSLGQSFHVMTERLLAEEEALKRRVEEVNEANLRLKQAQERLLRSERLASVGRLAAGLAHEVGNPIAAMMGLEELLLQGGLTKAEERDFLQRIARETERVHRILRDLLDFARPTQHPTSDAEEEPGDVGFAVEETLALVGPQKLFRELLLETTLEGDLPLVRLSRPKLVQVLLNLLLNAADALGTSGSIVISAKRANDGTVEVSVTDNGPGVPQAIIPSLFEPFVTTKEVGKGTGLGLAVCRGLVEGAGGSIALDEQHHPGARFLLKLPAQS
jgi:signal transduction histidine kinase